MCVNVTGTEMDINGADGRLPVMAGHAKKKLSDCGPWLAD